MLEAILAAAAGVLGAGIGAWAALRARRPTEAKVEFVDIAVVPIEDLGEVLEGAEGDVVTALRERARWMLERYPHRSNADWTGWGGNDTQDDYYPLVLDVKLRNSGGQTAYVHEFGIHVRDVLRVSGRDPQLLAFDPDAGRSMPLGGQVVTSAYTVRNDLRRERESSAKIRRQISQVLPPGGVDRFIVVMQTYEFGRTDKAAFFRMTAEVSYNADQTVRSAQPLRSPLLCHPVFLSTGDQMERLRREIQLSRQPGWHMRMDGARMEPAQAVRRWFEEYEQQLKMVASIYVETGSDGCEEYSRIQDALAQIPAMQRELGLSE